ncbi:MAG: AAA-like domain-containing protein [Caldilineaceae bacterium]
MNTQEQERSSTSTDFFKAGGTLHANAPSYVPRAADEELFKRLLAGQFCYVLTSRQMGKSSLMIRTAARLRQQGIQTAIIDLSGLGTQVTSAQWYLGLLTRLGSELKLGVDVEAWWQARKALSVVQRFTDFVHEVVLAEAAGKIVIFVDEIDSTLKLAFTDDFFAAIRTFYNARASDASYERLTFVLLGVAAPADLIKNRNLTPFNIGYGIDLQELSRADAQPLADGLNRRFPGQGEALLDRIFAWTNGHPYLTQKLCHAVTEQTNVGAPPDVDTLVQRLFLAKDAQNEDNLQFVRSNVEASPERRRLVQIYQRVYKGQTVGEDERSPVQHRLKLIGLVRTRQGVLEVRNRIYRQVFNQAWIRQQTPVEWSKLVIIGSGLVALMALSLLFWSQYQQATERFVTNQETFLDQDAAVNVRMTNLAYMCELRPARARDAFFALAPAERLELIEQMSVTVLGPRLPTLAACLQPGLADVDPDYAQPLQAALQTALTERCIQQQLDPTQAECQLEK